MIEVRQTKEFREWATTLRDPVAKARIAARIQRVARGNFGDVEAVGEGVCELRIHHGPGYRLYFVQKGFTLVVLLCGGDKGSQARDIAKAKALAIGLED